MVAQSASLAGATPEQTAALLRQLVQASAVSAVPQQHAQQAQHAQQQQPPPLVSLSVPAAPAVNGFVFGAHGAAGEAEAKPAVANMDKATRAAMFGPKGQVRPGQCRWPVPMRAMRT